MQKIILKSIYNFSLKYNFRYPLIWFVCFILTQKTYSQQLYYPLTTDYFNFINYEQNIINFPADSTNFNLFFEKYKNLIKNGDGKLDIIHIGGSHIQADVYTNIMREQLQDFYPGLNGGRGLIFPYNIAKSNNPQNYIVKYTGKWDYCKNVLKKDCIYGLTGYQIFTNDSLSTIEIFAAKKHRNYEFNKIKIFHNLTDSGKYEINIKVDSVNAKKIEFPEFGYTEFYLGKYLNILKLTITKKDTSINPFRLYGIYLDTDDPGIVYNSVGVNGASIPSFLKCSLLTNNLAVIKPDMVILSLGTNDAYGLKFNPEEYKNNYDTLIQRILSVNKNTAILITVPNDDYYKKRYPNKNTELQEKVIYELATKYNAGIWNLYKIMGGFNSSQKWYLNKLMRSDRIHFTSKGYILKGQLFFNAFLNSYNNFIDKDFNLLKNESKLKSD